MTILSSIEEGAQANISQRARPAVLSSEILDNDDTFISKHSGLE